VPRDELIANPWRLADVGIGLAVSILAKYLSSLLLPFNGREIDRTSARNGKFGIAGEAIINAMVAVA
jgi:hypothetical protein